MPKNDACNHRRCGGEPCRMLTAEELKPEAADHELAKQLVAEGWLQTSAKYRMIRRWVHAPPKIEDMIKEEWARSWWADRLVEHYKSLFGGDLELRCAPLHMVETRTLSMREFRAFKIHKNRLWEVCDA